MQYFQTAPGPLSQVPAAYEPADIRPLMEKLRPYRLAKGELIMIVNLRPATHAALYACIDEAQERFSEDQQQDILDIIAQSLGQLPPKPQAPDGGKVNDAADPDPEQSVESAAP